MRKKWQVDSSHVSRKMTEKDPLPVFMGWEEEKNMKNQKM